MLICTIEHADLYDRLKLPGTKAKYADTYQWFDALNTACQYVLTQHADLTHANVHLVIYVPVVGLVQMVVRGGLRPS